MALPLPWVEKIFQKLALVYGRDFIGRWEGQNLGDVMADWSHELAPLAQNPAAIKYGLENLPPDKPPTCLQFRSICNRRPEAPMPALPAPKTAPSPEVMEKVAEIGKPRIEAFDPKAWAKKLKARELENPRSHGLTRAQREMWRTALGEQAAA